MMRKFSILVLVLGMTSTAGAALSLVPDSLYLIPEQTGVIQVVSDVDGGYGCWIALMDLSVADYDGAPVIIAPGVPPIIYPPYDPQWYGEIIISSLDPANPIRAGAHINVNLVGITAGVTTLGLYASDGITLYDSATVTVLPEPMTIALLGLGGLFLLRRRK